MRFLFSIAMIFPFSSLFVFIASAQSGPGGVGTSATNVLWMKADAGTSSVSSGASISSWTDQSGNGITFTQTSGSQQPVYISSLMNGFPAIEFDNNSSAGQNDFFIAPDNSILDNTSGYSFFTVTRMKGFGTAQSIISKRVNVGNEEAFMLFFYSGNQLYVDIDNDNNRFSSGVSNTINTNKIYDVFYDGTITPALTRSSIYDGENFLINNVESSALVADKNSPVLIGATHNGDPRAFNGYISEIIMYRTKVNVAQRIILNNYLSAKYDIALSTNDFYAGDNAANGDYDRNVAGIGKDGNGTTNPEFYPVASAGLGIASVSGLDNNDYILAGHKFPSNSQLFTDISGITGPNPSRWQRIWYIDVTNSGTSNTVNITFDMSDGGMSGTTLGLPSNYVLVYRSTQTGTWTELTTASSVSGDQVIFSGYTLTNDGYYTLATKDSELSPLPVELLSFSAAYNNETRHAELQWSTATEHDNDYFLLKRSSDAVDWETIATIDGAGNSLELINYFLEDLTPLSGTSYYQLIQVDFDGTQTPSDIRSISKVVADNRLLIYPNPARTLVNIECAETPGSMNLYSQTGQLISDQSAFQQTSAQHYILDVSGLEPGVYLLEFNQQRRKLVIGL